jgi:transaldolase
MKFFLDTADVEEIREGAKLGLVDGVTTNPSLVSQTGKKFRDVLTEILEIVNGPISAEVVSLDYDGMMQEARSLSSIHRNVVVKVPLTLAGLQAARSCKQEGIHTNVTLCFSAPQALLAAKAGASYVSPFVGRLDDVGEDGMRLVQDILDIYKGYGYETQVLVASVRHPNHVYQAAMMGAHVATMPIKVMKQLASHPLTDVGLAKFLKDWEKVPK